MQADWPYPKLFAHRGGGTHAPENTLAAMRCGVAQGYRAVEFDVKLSQDNVPILLHDEALARTTSGTTSGSGRAQDYSAAELSKLDAGSWHSSAFAGEPVPRFDAVTHYLLSSNTLANVEIKPCAGREALTGQLVAQACKALYEHQPQHLQPLISSFSVEALRAARAVSKQLRLGLLVKQPSAADSDLLNELNCVSYHFAHTYATQTVIDAAHQRGLRVMLYTVNDVERARTLFAMGVDGLFTDALQVFSAAFPNHR
jgi:glycerophosphoryl diester phosphodiesterase